MFDPLVKGVVLQPPDFLRVNAYDVGEDAEHDKLDGYNYPAEAVSHFVKTSLISIPTMASWLVAMRP